MAPWGQERAGVGGSLSIVKSMVTSFHFCLEELRESFDGLGQAKKPQYSEGWPCMAGKPLELWGKRNWTEGPEGKLRKPGLLRQSFLRRQDKWVCRWRFRVDDHGSAGQRRAGVEVKCQPRRSRLLLAPKLSNRSRDVSSLRFPPCWFVNS